MADLSTKPYLIRAIHEWCADCGHTPYLAVVVDDRTVVPRPYVKNGEIVLNVSMSATNRLSIGNELIEFQARFGGAAHELSIPIENVTAIYARETGHGMAFDVPKPAAVKEDRRDDRRPPKPVAVASVPRPVPTVTPAAPSQAGAAGSVPAALPAPSPEQAAPPPPQAVEADVAEPAGEPDRGLVADTARNAGSATEIGADSTGAGPTGGEQATETASPAGAAMEPDAPEPDGGGGGRPRRGGRPKLTRIK